MYTDDGTTYLYDEYTIHVHAIMAAGLAPANGNEPPAQTWGRIMGCLSKPRGVLVYSDGPNQLLVSPLPGEDTDAKNGPIPGVWNVRQISPASYSVEFQVTTWVYNCCQTASGNTEPFIAHRWIETQTIDLNMTSKWVRKGKMFFRADLLETTNTTADDYRDQIVLACPLKPRHLRQSEYTIQSDGLVLEYSITDTEVYAVPLPPLTDFKAEYRMTTIRGGVFQEEINVQCWGNVNTPKGQLYNVAAVIASSRLTAAGFFDPGRNPGGKAIWGGYWREHLHENYVELHLQLIKNKFNTTFLGLQFTDNQASLDPPGGGGNPYAGTPDQVPNPGARGTDKTLKLVASLMQDPCLNAAINVNVIRVAGDSDALVDQTIEPATITTVPVIASNPTNYAYLPADGPCYITSIMDIDYRQDQHILQMPVASSSINVASFAVLANPTMKKIVTYTMEATGEQPQLPETVSSDENEVLLDFRIIPSALDVEADGTVQTWKVSGVYTYGIKDFSTVTIMAGKLPYLTQDYNQTEIPDIQFVTGLSSP